MIKININSINNKNNYKINIKHTMNIKFINNNIIWDIYKILWSKA